MYSDLVNALTRRLREPPKWFFWLAGASVSAYGGWLLFQYLFPATEDIVTDPTLPGAGRQEEGFVKGESIGMLQLIMVGNTPMTHNTARAFIAMRDAAARDGVVLTIVPLSGFRTMVQQQALYARYLARGKTAPRVAVPGRSNHQGGIAVDIASASEKSSRAFKWLTANAARFGFDNVEGQRVKENWHWTILGPGPTAQPVA